MSFSGGLSPVLGMKPPEPGYVFGFLLCCILLLHKLVSVVGYWWTANFLFQTRTWTGILGENSSNKPLGWQRYIGGVPHAAKTES